MPHYKDGTPAKVGDVVRGKGYNVKGPDGQLKEITGVVVHINPGSESCNLQVEFVEISRMPDGFSWPDLKLFRLWEGVRIMNDAGGGHSIVTRGMDYGETAHFEKIA